MSTLRDLRSALEGLPSEVTPSILEQATREIHSVTEAQAHRAEIQTRRHAEDQRAALEERARLTLAAATACRMVLDGIKDLETAWRLVVSSGYPFAGLARLVGQPASSDVQSEAVGLSGDQARRRLERAAEVAKELLRTLARPGDPDAAVSDPRPEARVEVYGW